MKDPFAKRRGLRLKPLQVSGFERPIDLVDGKLTVGRAPDNDLELPAEDFPSVSTHHLRLELVEGDLWLDDLGSRNGTLVNGHRIERRQLALGDVIQLGAIGPRFVVVSNSPLSETMFVDPRKMGINEDEVHDLVHARARRQSLRIAGLGLVAVAALVWWGLDLAERGRLNREASDAELADALELIEDLRAETREREARGVSLETQRQVHIAALEATVAGREEEASDLRRRLTLLEGIGASTEEIEHLQAELDRTRADLKVAHAEFSKFDPVNLEALRLSEVSRVRETVVLIEARMTLINGEGQVLHLDAKVGPNWEDKGEPWALDSSGTGFCISPEGYVLTNAHVISPPEDHALVINARRNDYETRMQLAAVFSDSDERHPLEVVRRAKGVDLALARLEPFEGLPYIENFTADVPSPPSGSVVYLMGFPLGNFAIQEGRRVIASTFRGILSRVVDGNLQVDAGVHPGNSGGPITDPSGRVIGIVFSVQSTPEHTAVYTIGYGIPIDRAAQLWPRPQDGDEGVEVTGD
jgi:S1-C subfamily serine protease